MLILQGALSYPSIEDFGPQTAEQVVNLIEPVHTHVALLSGFVLDFFGDDNSDDPQLHLLQIDLGSNNLSQYAVEVNGRLGVRDRSGQWDDNYGGTVIYTLVGAQQGEEILGGTLTFPSSAGAGPRTRNETLQFTQSATNATAGLSGFLARFTTSDHPLQQLEVDVDSQTPGPNQLQVSGTYGLRDASGTWDDRYDGRISYAALGGGTARMLKIRTGRLEFSSQGGAGPREMSMGISFAQPIGMCAAALTGFELAFAEGDHDIRQVVIETEAQKLSDTDVEVYCQLGLRDKSKDWDDPYYGSVRFVVLGS
jgi:hypothetical protein